MPKNKFQDFIFTVIMVLIMVYFMTLYNMSLEFGITNASFLNALQGMWFEVAAAFSAQYFIAGPIAKKQLARLSKLGVDKPILSILTMAGLNVSMMCPMMTLIVAIYHHGFSAQLLSFWLPKLIVNFPFALCIQIFYVGPLVRLIFRTLFAHQLRAAAPVRALS